jgi:hypothetical protein
MPDNNSEENNSSSNDGEPRRSGRVRKVSRTVASQLSQDRALAQRKTEAKAKKEAAKGKGKGRKVRKEKLKEISQLLDELDYTL